VSKKRKRIHVDTDDVEKQEEIETEDIYDDEQREKMLDDDKITAAENAFIQGREMKLEKRKGKKTPHTDTVSVELAEDEYTED
jgi:hexokinase